MSIIGLESAVIGQSLLPCGAEVLVYDLNVIKKLGLDPVDTVKQTLELPEQHRPVFVCLDSSLKEDLMDASGSSSVH